MADHHQEDEDLKLALQMSMQYNLPELKRSNPIGSGSHSGESPEAKTRRLQREIMAAAAEKRMVLFPKSPSPPTQEKARTLGSCLGKEESDQLFGMLFGDVVTKSILAQWTNQGIRYGFCIFQFDSFID